VDKEMKKKIIFIGCLETETPACSSFDIYSALLCVNPQILLKVAGIQTKDPGDRGPYPKKPADEAFSLFSPAPSGQKRILAAPGIDERLRAAGYLLKENELLNEAQRLATRGILGSGLMALLGQQALSRQIYDDLFKLSLMKLNEAQLAARLAYAERIKSEAVKSLCSGVKELRRYQRDLNHIELELESRRKGLAEAIMHEIQAAKSGPVCVVCGLGEKLAFVEYITKRIHGSSIEVVEYSQATTA
jgi:hypothetical protein